MYDVFKNSTDFINSGGVKFLLIMAGIIVCMSTSIIMLLKDLGQGNNYSSKKDAIKTYRQFGVKVITLLFIMFTTILCYAILQCMFIGSSRYIFCSIMGIISVIPYLYIVILLIRYRFHAIKSVQGYYFTRNNTPVAIATVGIVFYIMLISL